MSRYALITEGILPCQSMCGVKKKGQAMASTLKPFTNIASPYKCIIFFLGGGLNNIYKICLEYCQYGVKHYPISFYFWRIHILNK